MIDIQVIAANDLGNLNVPIKMVADEMIVNYDNYKFTFYKDTKLFNIGSGLMRHKECKKDTLMHSAWNFHFLHDVTATLNKMDLIIWIADDQMYVIADFFGNILMSVINERRAVARDWTIH